MENKYLVLAECKMFGYMCIFYKNGTTKADIVKSLEDEYDVNTVLTSEQVSVIKEAYKNNKMREFINAHSDWFGSDDIVEYIKSTESKYYIILDER